MSFIFFSLPIKSSSRLGMDYHHLLLNVSTNCTGNSIFTLQNKIAKVKFVRNFEVFQD